LNNKKNILICPLEWGLGHAGRMIPVARYLNSQNHNVFFGSGKEQLAFIKNELPWVKSIYFPGFRIRYSRLLPQYLVILFQSPVLIYHIIREHHRLKKIIREHSIDIVISDNRIGLWNSEIISVFVTHQLRIPFPRPFGFLEKTGILINRLIIRKYTYCFVPDLEGDNNVSGRLSHGIKIQGNVKYIGILSRFNEQAIPEYNPTPTKFVAMLSGPEPQRSILRKKIVKAFLTSGKPVAVFEGDSLRKEESETDRNITYFKHPSQSDTIKMLLESDTIISRSGYTTIMELISLRKSGLLIPTPGQTEQEYLAKYLSQKGWFWSIEQKDSDKITDSLKSLGSVPEGILEESDVQFKKAMQELLEE
jgi:spore coat polysaccharide biosynthesis predicted glycosyltransferase SpsG